MGIVVGTAGVAGCDLRQPACQSFAVAALLSSIDSYRDSAGGYRLNGAGTRFWLNIQKGCPLDVVLQMETELTSPPDPLSTAWRGGVERSEAGVRFKKAISVLF